MDEQRTSSFDKRLSAARDRHGLDPKPQVQNSVSVSSAWGIGLRIGIELVSAVAISVACGWALDRWLHTMPLFLCLSIAIGGAAGVLNVWRAIAPSGRR